ncbi:GSCFA domain-containing protein [Parasphingopyxis algicola]|uniref:GSCFA domain-containing protein n=1 Tax=Parasphingopyxis algicola TaxID=2026624 RepID=UPI0015A02C03|nr:GSCFA domain-containing protein [Parasphingopyxis algicola]QLC26660.1 GSCFA domain-containing protein [Parasphingopyxis algicola]
MPIIALNGPEAMRIRKANDLATWGSRTKENRVEPVAKPAFDTPFQLQPGEKIFTIGSCFARHVEGELVNRGFEIPMRDLFRKGAFEGLAPEIVNNFGTPSIYNEFAWAFGEQAFDEDKAIVEVGKDRFVDLHMVNSIRPGPFDEVLARRKGLLSATRSLADCRVLIMTLGLAEVWWDEEAQTYLNTAPLPTVLNAAADRFSLHVLDFAECHDYLKRALDIAFAHGRDDLRVILTVSPVPMMATHRRTDVITANSYSKSVLRTVAEHIVQADDRISYFPSYETVTLSDRRLAWMDDLVHVSKEMVGLNVDRMVDAFTGNPHPVERQLPATASLSNENAAALFLADQARSARALDDEAFFEEHRDEARKSPAFALEYAKFLFAKKDLEAALDILDNAQGVEAELLRASLLRATGAYDEAAAVAANVCRTNPKGQEQWRLRLDIAAARKDLEDIAVIEKEWLQAAPARRGIILSFVGSAFRRAGNDHEALDRLRDSGIDPADAEGFVAVEWAWALLSLQEYGEARGVIEKFVPRSDWQVNQVKQIRKKLAAAEAA